MKKVILFILVIIIVIIYSKAQTVTDIDGNVYNTITIGNQIWMKENLRVTHSNDGGEIPYVIDTFDWSNMSQPAYCYYNFDTNFANEYGKLYNYYAAGMINTLCPSGWHIPSQNDWEDLGTYLGGDSTAGGKMKETGILHWQYPNIGATNSCDFMALPGGKRIEETFSSMGLAGYWWSNTDAGPHTAWIVYITNSNEKLYMNVGGMNYGLSVRCLCDTTADNINEINFNGDLRVSPNPFSQSTRISFSQTYGDIAIEVYNLQGQLVANDHYKNCNGIVFQRKGLSEGMYFLKLTMDGKMVETKKIVITD